MTEFFRLATDEEIARWDAEATAAPQRRLPQVQCSCGRFAKYLRTEHYYNGNWNCERLWVRCSRCGDVGIELV
jgi:hypothetical protein